MPADAPDPVTAPTTDPAAPPAYAPPAYAPAPAGRLTVRTITAAEHLAHVEARGTASFLQVPSWAAVKPEWDHESIGWYAGERLVGAGLVLYRALPKVRRSLAYLPEGPVIDWADPDLARWLEPMQAHLRSRGAFGIRVGPPVVTRRWEAPTLKKAIADEALTTLGSVPADATDPAALAVAAHLRSHGWREQGADGGFAAGQPRYNFHLPLAGRTEEQVLAGMNQLWRRNIKKAAKAGVEVRLGTREDLPAFHAAYAETAARDRFTPRPLAYFQTMWDSLTAEDPDRMRLYLAEHEGDLVAATTMTRVGTHAWYSYGASTTEKRDVRGSNAIQWQMVRDALAAGAEVYDLRGITDTIAADDPHVGLIQFKVGTGGEAVEYVGEWDLPLSRPLYAAFDLYLKKR